AEAGLGDALSAVVRSGHLVSSETFSGIGPVDYYIITVGTPLKSGTYEPRLDMIENAARQVADHISEGAVVILRSTVRIGTTRKVVQPILAATGRHFHLAMCPERTLEGDALRELNELPQIIGGRDEASGDKASKLFRILTDTIVQVSDPETAEMIKLVDNTS